MPERTFRRADGELIFGEYEFVTEPDCFEDMDEPTEVIEEEWRLIRSRHRVIGPSGLCIACQGECELPTWDPVHRILGAATPCGRCNGSGREPEPDQNPPWEPA